MKKIVIIGAGITGLAAAHKLSKDGHNVVLVEANSQLGGLGTFFKHGENWIDKFYHCQMPSDNSLLKLIDEVGLMDQLYWKPTRMGFIINKKRYPFNTAMDLIKFNAISFHERIRFGVISLLLRTLGRNKDLDNLPIEKWFKRLYGTNVWEKILKQLFLSKFGDHSGNLPALYIWQRLGREKNIATRGYLKCGLKGLIDQIENKIRDYGGEIKINSRVQRITQTDIGVNVELENETIHADWVISTIALPQFISTIKGTNIENKFVNPNLKYQGVVNALFFLKRPLDNYYWTPVVNSDTEFDGIVEMTELVDKNIYGENHMVYTMKYCGKESDLFKEDDEKIIKRWKNQLLSLYPDLQLTEDEITDVKLFKAPYVEPIYPLGYLKIKPKMKIPDSNIILATSAQVYPNITSWNASTDLAYKSIELLYQHDYLDSDGESKLIMEKAI
jgi:protoporphyrinogen oxidase